MAYDSAIDIAAFRWNDLNLNEMLHGASGPVVKDLVRRGILVEASVKAHASGRPGPNVITGRLRGSITWKLGLDEESPYVDVGSAVEYAAPVEKLYPYLRPGLEAARTTF